MSGGYGSSLLFVILAILAAFCALAGLGLYTAVCVLRFVFMSPPVTLRQAMIGRHGRLRNCACCCCCFPTFELARQTPERVRADRTLVSLLVALFLAAFVVMLLAMAICGGHFMDQGSWEPMHGGSQFGALLQVLCAITMFATACVTLLAGCCGCAMCSPQEPAGDPIEMDSDEEADG